MLYKLLLFLLLLCLPVMVLAQAENTITIGDTVTGALTAAAPSAQYTLDGHAGDVVTITLTSDTFDSFLTLLAPDGTALITDDDSGGGKHAQIADFTLPADGAYTIVAESYNRVSSGEYMLSVRGTAASPAITPEATDTPASTPSPAGTLAYGETVTGQLAENSTAPYTFEGAAGDRLTITAISDDFDAFLTLKDADGTTLATDDDRAGNLNARIDGFVLPADSTYTAIVSSYNTASAGAFTLQLERIESGVQDRPTPTPEATVEATLEATVEVTPATAEPGGTLAVGETVTGTLTAEQPSAAFTFEGLAGQRLTMTLTSEDFDAYLVLRDASGAALASDDDSGGGLNAQITAFTLPDDGLYTLVAGSYSNNGTGDFALTVDFAVMTQTAVPTETPVGTPEAPTETPAPTLEATAEATAAGDTITIGQTITGRLTGGEPAAYTLTGSAGAFITISLNSDDFDAYVRLLDADGQELAADDDSGDGLNARIALFQLPADGAYLISAESFSGTDGAFTLSLSAITPRAIEYTQTVEGALSVEQPTAVYRFRGQAGDVVTIGAQSSAFDAYLLLAQSNAAVLNEDDDSGGNLNPLIGPFALPETGDYLITVRSLNDSMGAFTLALDKVALSEIAYGDTVRGEFTADTPALYYRFDGSSGDVIHIRASSGGTLDTSLSLRGPDGYEVAFDDDSGENNDPEINRLVLTEDGVYTLLIKPFTPGLTGRINLTLAREVLASLDSGTGTVQLNEKQAQDVLTFTGAAGERVRLTARVVEDGGSAPVLAITQEGQTLATAEVTGVTALALEFVVPADGAVNVQISDYNFARVTLELTLERVGE